MQCPFLIGSGVYLRPLEVEDAEAMTPWMNDADVTRTLEFHRPVAVPFERDFIERVAKSEHDIALGIVTRADDRLIGTVGLHRINWRDRQAAFGIEIGEKSEWGKGYGTESTRLMTGYAFESLNLHRVWLHVYDHNAAGMRAYEKVGYRREGVLRESAFREGRYHDTIVMAILASEWKAAATPR